jgi:hypothetical protein
VAQDEKREEEVLFPEFKVGDVVVRPWSYGQFLKVFPVFKSMLPEIEARGINEKNIEAKILDFVDVVLPHVDEVLSITTEMTKEQIHALRLSNVIQLTVVVLTQNVGHLKNSFGLVRPLIQRLNQMFG